jgi:hypothetical protein
LAAASSLISVVGFIIQFVGLRALHWSATIIQLGITIIMTGIRTWARRGLASDPETDLILDGHEIAWLTLRIISKKADSPQSNSEEMPRAISDPKLHHREVEVEALQSRQQSSKVAEITPEINSSSEQELV